MSTHAEDNVEGSSAAALKDDPKRLGRVIAGLVFLLISAGYLVMAWDMPRGTLASPGPGLFPVGVGIAAVVISAYVLIEALLGKSESGPIDFPKGQGLKVSGIFVATLIAYILLLPFLGQYLASCLYAVAFIRFGGKVSWVRSVIVGAIIALGLTFVFQELLGLNLPSGTLFS